MKASIPTDSITCDVTELILIYILPKLTERDTIHNRFVSIERMESVNDNLPNEKPPDSDEFASESDQTFTKFSQSLPEDKAKEESLIQ